jgi:hypothetical protein
MTKEKFTFGGTKRIWRLGGPSLVLQSSNSLCFYKRQILLGPPKVKFTSALPKSNSPWSSKRPILCVSLNVKFSLVLPGSKFSWYYNGYVYIFRACHWRLTAAHYLQAVAVQFVQLMNLQTKQSIKVYCLLFVYFYTVPNSLG